MPRLTDEEEKRLRREFASGRPEAVDHLVRATLGLVVKIAMDFRGLGLPFEDLINEGNVGLMKAAHKFDAGRGTKFSTYAVWWIRKSMLRALSTKSELIRPPERHSRTIRRFRQAETALLGSLGRMPSREEVSRHLSESIADLDRALQHRARPVSIHEELGERRARTLEDLLGDPGMVTPEQRLLKSERRIMLAKALSRLPEKHRFIVERRFGLTGDPPETLSQVSVRTNLSRERVRQIESEAKRRLRRILTRRPWMAPGKWRRGEKPGDGTVIPKDC